MIYGYLRVSTDEQDSNNQKLGVCKKAESLGLSVDDWIIDDGISGTKEPEKRLLGKLMKKLQKGDVIITSELSRLGRKLFMIMRILEFCMLHDVKVYTVKDGYELGDNIQSKVLAFAFGIAAEIERDMISQRTKEALARKRLEGVILGRPKGRRTSPDKLKLSSKTVLINALLNEGVSQRKIAKICKVDRNTLARFLKNNINQLA
jgi:DNA invertase Pin-like site-specific DNA recombinase